MLKGIEARLSNSEKQMKEQEEQATELSRQNRLLKKAIYSERNKTVWQKLFHKKPNRPQQKIK
jgi:hypothetical protein